MRPAQPPRQAGQIEFWRALSVIVDALAALSISATGLVLLLLSLAAAPLVRRIRRRRVSSAAPERLLIIGYTALAEARAKGIIQDYQTWFNPGGAFRRVIVYIPVGRARIREQLDGQIEYREDAAPFGPWAGSFRVSNRAANLLAGAIRAARFAIGCDVMQVNGPNAAAVPALYARVMTGTPAVVFIEAFWEDILDSQFAIPAVVRRLLPSWYAIVYRAFDAYIGGPSMYPERYQALGMSIDRIQPFLNNVDVENVQRTAASATPPQDVLVAPRPRIVCVGRLHPEKLVEDAVRIVAELHQRSVGAHLIFVGDGPARGDLERLANSLGVAQAITFAGMLPLPRALAAVRACDVFLATYQGNALVEAMSVGIPIVAFDNPPHRVFLGHGERACMVKDRDIAAAAEALIEVFTSPAEARARAGAAQQWVERTYQPDELRRVAFAPFSAIHRPAKA